MDLAAIRRWDTASLAHLHAALSARVTTVAQAQDALRDIGRLPGWEGSAADAARREFAASASGLDDELATVGAVRELTRQVDAAVTDLKRQLSALEIDADANRMTLHDSGAVTFAAHGMSDDDRVSMERVRADLEATSRALIAQATDVDHDAADVLNRAADGRIDAHGASGADAIAAGQTQGSLTTDPPPADASPSDVRRYWDALAPEQKGYILSKHPDWVGNRDGIPAAVRHPANREMVNRERNRLTAERDTLARDIDNHPFGGTFTNEDAHLWYVNQKLKDLDAIDSTLAKHPDAKLLLMDMRSGQRGHAAIAIGDPDTAQHIAVTTPGLGTTVNRSLDGMTNEAEALQRETGRQLQHAGRDPAGVATIAWIGYDAPNFDGPSNSAVDSLSGSVAILGDGHAESAAPGLARFYDGLDAASSAPDPHITALGHSYGSLTTSLAVQQSHGSVDDVVFYGSPGLGTDGHPAIDSAEDLGVAPGHGYVIEDEGDAVADSRAFGDDPSSSHLTQLSADAGMDRTGEHRDAAHGHADYPRSSADGRLKMSGYNMAAVIAGLAAQNEVLR